MAALISYEKLSKLFDAAFRAKKHYDHSMFCENVWHGMYQSIDGFGLGFMEKHELVEEYADKYERASSLHTDLMWNALFELFKELEELEGGN